MKPSIGRIVIYCVPTDERKAPFGNEAEFLPAIITRVWTDSTINLKIIADGPYDYWRTSVTLDDSGEIPQQMYTWRWPELVK